MDAQSNVHAADLLFCCGASDRAVRQRRYVPIISAPAVTGSAFTFTYFKRSLILLMVNSTQVKTRISPVEESIVNHVFVAKIYLFLHFMQLSMG